MDDLTGWLKLAHTPGIGQRTRDALLAHYSHPEQIFAASAAQLRSAGLNQARIDALLSRSVSATMQALTEQTRAWLRHPLNHIIHRQHALYPPKLQQISDAPIVLYITGDPEVLLTPSIGIVGSRKCTSPARATAQAMAAKLADAGLTINSGLALGIDQAAHQSALDAGGLTLAVAGTGLDRVYPARHAELAQAIVRNGAMVSELPLGSGPVARHFPRRNRIISGLSLGVVLVEAALKSGSLITARHARDQGREVMVVPGSVNNPQSKGCHALIREGATLVQSADDIIAEVAAQIDIDPRITSRSPPSATMERHSDNNKTCILLNLMGFDPITVDSLVILSGQDIPEVTTGLSQLELEGQITGLSGGRYIRC